MSLTRPTRIWYVSDLHGSTRCYSLLAAMLTAANMDKSLDAIIVGGDLCGDSLVPILRTNSNWTATIEDKVEEYFDRATLELRMDTLAQKGYYPYECDEAELNQLRDLFYARRMLEQLALKRFSEWLTPLASHLSQFPGSSCQLLINTGTSDPSSMDEVIRSCGAPKHILHTEGQIHRINGNVEIASTAYREEISGCEALQFGPARRLPANELRDRLRKLLGRVDNMERCIFNFHVPPYDTNLDTRRTGGLHVFGDHTGSSIIKEEILFHQPLAAVHGYAHTSLGAITLGTTKCFSPGSEFYNGRLPGILLTIDADNTISYHFTRDPSEELWEDADQRIFRACLRSAIRNLVPFIGPFSKFIDDIKRELDADISWNIDAMNEESENDIEKTKRH